MQRYVMLQWKCNKQYHEDSCLINQIVMTIKFCDYSVAMIMFIASQNLLLDVTRN